MKTSTRLWVTMSISIAEGTFTMSDDNSIGQALRELGSTDSARKLAALKLLRGVKDSRLAAYLIRCCATLMLIFVALPLKSSARMKLLKRSAP